MCRHYSRLDCQQGSRPSRVRVMPQRYLHCDASQQPRSHSRASFRGEPSGRPVSRAPMVALSAFEVIPTGLNSITKLALHAVRPVTRERLDQRCACSILLLLTYPKYPGYLVSCSGKMLTCERTLSGHPLGFAWRSAGELCKREVTLREY
jgi:hypothetical protein